MNNWRQILSWQELELKIIKSPPFNFKDADYVGYVEATYEKMYSLFGECEHVVTPSSTYDSYDLCIEGLANSNFTLEIDLEQEGYEPVTMNNWSKTKTNWSIYAENNHNVEDDIIRALNKVGLDVD